MSEFFERKPYFFGGERLIYMSDPYFCEAFPIMGDHGRLVQAWKLGTDIHSWASTHYLFGTNENTFLNSWAIQLYFGFSMASDVNAWP